MRDPLVMAGVVEPLGVVLAGGASLRMGAPKATLQVGAGTLIDRPLATLAAAGLEAVVVAKRDSSLPRLQVPRWDEPDLPRHPLCGIVAALERARRPVIALACDLPFVPPELVALLARKAGAVVVPAANGTLQPLVARYEPAALPQLTKALREEASLHRAIESIGPVEVDEAELRRIGDPERIFVNVNRPRDLERLRESGARA